MNRKVKSFKQTVFLSEQCAMSTVTTSVRIAVFRPRHRPTIVFSLVYCPVDNTLFKVSPEIRCSVRQVTTVAMATMQMVLNQFKTFYPNN